MKKTSSKTSPYVITMQMGTLTLKGQGKTALEALISIERPTKITTKTIVELTKGKQKSSRLLSPVQAKRFFYPLSQPYMAKQLDFMLK